MKRFILTIALLLPVLAARGQEPQRLSFTQTIEVPDIPGRYVYVRFCEWLEGPGASEFSITPYSGRIEQDNGHYKRACFGWESQSFRFRLIPRRPSITFNIDFECVDGQLKVTMTDIRPSAFGVLYGDDGRIYGDLYSRRDYQFLNKIVSGMASYFNALCDSLYEWMEKPSTYEPPLMRPV